MTKRDGWFFGFLFSLTILRLWLASTYEISPDEAYYDLWAQHPDIAYYSKGPGVALTILASTAMFGHTEFGVRFFSPLLGLGTSLILYYFAKLLYRDKVAFWTVIALNMVPIFNVGSMVMTIDPLSIFFWSAALFSGWLALTSQRRRFLYWLLTGLLIGCGFLSKYTNAFQILSIVLFLLLVPRYRGELLRPGFYSMLAIFLLFTVPPIIWNQQHEWITLAHLTSRGGLDKPFSFRWSSLGQFVGGQLGVYSPVIMIGCVAALLAALRKFHRLPKVAYLVLSSLPILITYLLLALKQPGEPNWTAPGLVSAGILTAAWWFEAGRNRRWLRYAGIVGLVVAALMTLFTLNTDLLRIAGMPIPYRLDPSSRLRGWKSITQRVEQFRHDFERGLGEKVFLIGNKYQTASMISFYLQDPQREEPGHPPVYIPESQDFQNQFSFWPRYDEFVAAPDQGNSYFSQQDGVNHFINRTALFITDHNDTSAPDELQSSFNKCELVAVFQLRRRELELRQVRVFACYQYQTRPL